MIPKRLHRIWIGPYRMPAEYVANGQAWANFGWAVLDWSLDQLRQVPVSDETRAVLDEIEAKGANPGGGLVNVAKWVQLADVWSYELLREFGGVYANCDIEPLRDLPTDGLSAFVVAEDGHFLSNALMGGEAGHPFWRAVSEGLPQRFWSNRWGEMNTTTGPHHLTHIWNSAGFGVPRLEPVPFFPVRFTEERDRDADWRPPAEFFVDHHWGHRHPELLEEA